MDRKSRKATLRAELLRSSMALGRDAQHASRPLAARGVLLVALALLAALSFGCSASSDCGAYALHDPATSSAAVPSIEQLDVCLRIVAGNGQSDRGVQGIQLGSVGQGGSLRRTLIVENRSAKPVLIDRVATSCECVTFTGLPLRIAPRAAEPLDVLVDESAERDFRGNLAIDAAAYGGANRAFRCQLHLSVIAPARLPAAPAFALNRSRK